MRKFLAIGIVLLFGVFATIDLLHPGFAFTHDGQDHIARIANFYLNLAQGVIIPRWAENLNFGYGHPILEFLYPFPSYLASLFRFLGFSFVDSTKFVYGLGLIASGVAMYVFVRALWGEEAGVVSGILYMYAPYHLVDLYVRGDIGENMAFVFIPLTLWGMFRLVRKQSVGNILVTAISMALLILSHNAVALMFAPLVVLYGLYLAWEKKWKKKLLLFLGTGFILGFFLSAFFWLPALLEGQYTLRNIVTKGQYVSRFISFPQLIYGPWSYGISGMFTVQLGILHWIFLLSGVIILFTFWKKKRSLSILLIGLLLYTFAAIFLMLSVSNIFWSHFMLLQNFQFPWRFLAIPVFTLSLMGGIVVATISSKYKKVSVIAIALILLLLSFSHLHARSYEQKPEIFFTGIYDRTTDTGESSPIWSIRGMEHGYSSPLQVISGNATVTQEQRLVTLHRYTVASVGQSRLLENTLYFPGWEITVDGKQVSVQFQDPKYRGLMTFYVANGTHEVVVSYHESKLRLLGDLVSVVGLAVVGFLLILRKQKKLI